MDGWDTDDRYSSGHPPEWDQDAIRRVAVVMRDRLCRVEVEVRHGTREMLRGGPAGAGYSREVQPVVAGRCGNGAAPRINSTPWSLAPRLKMINACLVVDSTLVKASNHAAREMLFGSASGSPLRSGKW
jgi:hypothetical protein